MEIQGGRQPAGQEASRKPRRLRPLVAFSSGPYAAALADGSEYTGSYVERVTFEQLVDFHRRKLQVRAQAPNGGRMCICICHVLVNARAKFNPGMKMPETGVVSSQGMIMAMQS